MAKIIYRKQNPDSEPHTHSWMASTLVGGVVIVALLISIGLPKVSNSGPPPGVEFYEDGNLVCWDKVVCCDPTDQSTCASIPICHMKQLNWLYNR